MDFCKSIANKYGIKAFATGEEMIADPEVEAVIVTTLDQFHEQYVMAAIKAGKYVFCEKPLAPEADACRRIVDAEMAGGKQLVQVGFMRRYDRGYNQVKELLDSGKFGAPLVVKCTHRADGVAPDYTTAMAVTDTAIHEIDCLPWLVNDEWDEVQCIMPKVSSKAHEGLKDPQVMIMKTKGGVVVVLEVNVNCGFGYDINAEVVCSSISDGVKTVLSVILMPTSVSCTVWALSAAFLRYSYILSLASFMT